MKVVRKFGFTAADALRLVRDANKVLIFCGFDDDRFILEVPKAAVVRDLKMVPAHQTRFCELDIVSRTLYFGNFRAKHHADLVRKAGLFPTVQP